MSLFERIKAQYEKFPYPSIPLFAKMRESDSHLMNYESGIAACFGDAALAADKPKILIVGCGTFEPYVVALANRNAEITAVDFSSASIRKLKWRMRLHFPFKKIHYVCKSLESLPADLGKFHMIVATGILHHLENPLMGLKILVSHLEQNGVMRIMLYSKQGRNEIYKIRDLANVLQIKDPKKIKKIMMHIPKDSPMKSQFYLYSDIHSKEGIQDGFLNVIDKPFDALECDSFLASAGLKVKKFLHSSSGQPSRFDALRASEFCKRGDWEKIAALDRVSELESNFIFWANVMAEERPAEPAKSYLLNPALKASAGKRIYSKIIGEHLIVPSPGKKNIPHLDKYIDALWILPSSKKLGKKI